MTLSRQAKVTQLQVGQLLALAVKTRREEGRTTKLERVQKKLNFRRWRRTGMPAGFEIKR